MSTKAKKTTSNHETLVRLCGEPMAVKEAMALKAQTTNVVEAVIYHTIASLAGWDINKAGHKIAMHTSLGYNKDGKIVKAHSSFYSEPQKFGFIYEGKSVKGKTKAKWVDNAIKRYNEEDNATMNKHFRNVCKELKVKQSTFESALKELVA